MNNDIITLFDLDGTLCDFDTALLSDLNHLRSPKEEILTEYVRIHPARYLLARARLIMSSQEWWENLPQSKLGFDIWNLIGELGYTRSILTQGPKRNPSAWIGKKKWIDKNLGIDTQITITRNKSLVYGKVLVDDWPDYITGWLKWRPRGLVIMPAHPYNSTFSHHQVIRYDGSNLEEIKTKLKTIN